jgi:hypothetical protein
MEGSPVTPYYECDYHDAMLWAFNLAADSVDAAEYAGAETRAEVALHRLAAMDVAKRIQRMADRYVRKHLRK